MLRRPGRLFLMLSTGLIAAVFEGGTLGLFGLSVKVLTDDTVMLMQELPDVLDNKLGLYLQNISRGGVFLLLIGFAVGSQIIKGLMSYVSMIAQIGLSYELVSDGQNKATGHVMKMS